MWGKNDRGQMGVGSGIGIDMYESEPSPTPTRDENGEPIIVKNFSIGQNTTIMQDMEGRILQTGLKLYYHPHPI